MFKSTYKEYSEDQIKESQNFHDKTTPEPLKKLSFLLKCNKVVPTIERDQNPPAENPQKINEELQTKSNTIIDNPHITEIKECSQEDSLDDEMYNNTNSNLSQTDSQKSEIINNYSKNSDSSINKSLI